MYEKNVQKTIIPAVDIFDLVHSEEETAEHKTAETIYYEHKYTTFKNKGVFISWNWGAFFCGMAWLWYRKMYAYFFALITLQSLIQFIIEYRLALGHDQFASVRGWGFVLFFIVNIFLCGLFGNALYFRFLRIKYMVNVHHLGTNHWIVTFIVVTALSFFFDSMVGTLVKVLTPHP